MPLTDTAIRNAKPKAKPYKLTDGEGLYLLVNPNGFWGLCQNLGQVDGSIFSLAFPDEISISSHWKF